MLFYLIVANFLNIYLLVQGNSNPLTVQTKSGIVEGAYLDTGNGKQVIAWLGIPYATAKRFETPVPSSKWKNPLNASTYGPSCWQDIKEAFYGSVYWNKLTLFNENCLSLNIFKPTLSKPTKKLAVLVWIHSGAFSYGSSSLNLFDLKEFASVTNTITISINYRLDVFGFLKTGENVRGNMGLLDQTQALVWIHKNVEFFGGDPKKVTLAGEGAGGVSVSYHLLTDSRKQLFQQVIILNGDPISNWYFDDNKKASEKASLLGEVMECPINKVALIRCLKRKTVKQLLEGVSELVVNTLDEIPFGPTVDRIFMKDNPEKLLSKLTSLKDFRVLVGINGNAGSVASRELLPMQDKNKMDEDMFNFSAETALSRFSQDIYEKVTKFYTTTDHNGSNYVKTFNNLVGDIKYTCSAQRFVDVLHKKGADVHKVFFNHRPKNSKWPKWAGVVQQDELMFILGEPFRKNPVIKFTDKEKKLSKQLMNEFGRFVKQENLTKLPIYDTKTKSALKVENGELKTVKNHFYREKFCKFWSNTHVKN